MFSKWSRDRPDVDADKTTAFSQYLHDTYIAENALFPPTLWASKTSDTTRTTNACESFHAHFKRSFSSPHPHIFQFVHALVSFQTEIYVKTFDSDERTRSCHTRKKVNWIRQLIARQTPDDDPYQFAKRVSCKFGRIFDNND